MARSRWLLPLLVVGLLLDLAISAWLWQQNDTLSDVQHVQGEQITAARCWDNVLVVALRDHMTPAQRAALTVVAEHCAEITR